MKATKRMAVDLTVRALVFLIVAIPVVGRENTNFDETLLQERWNKNVQAMFVFGDSVLDAGTNNYFASLLKANMKPYGEAYFGKPTGRFTNGRTYADFFAERLGLNSPEPYLKRERTWHILKGVNYASGGSGVLETTNEEKKVISFPHQILQFNQTRISITQTLGSDKAAQLLFSQSLFLISIGGNDLIRYLSPTSPPFDIFLKNLTTEIEKSVGQLYEAGGRKFMFLSLGPVGCIPAVLVNVGSTDGTCYEPANALAKAYNTLLEQMVLQRFPKIFPDIKAIVGKPYETLAGLVANGKESGFTGGLNACCGYGLYNAQVQCGLPPSLITNPPYNVCEDVHTYLFWDHFHPTERVYAIVAKMFWNGGLDIVAPMNLKTLAKL
ncbi:hypothetical protein R1flu_005073 [Riccia fluitans]|uniref:GDSL esterase/lipase n=1 Tax=Riccia fluitans TaxID=41844 RepID=A0ABD1YUX0_9MARC